MLSGRLTEILESDVYICTSVYDEINRQVKKLLPDGLKKYVHGTAVTEDEIYYFPKLINVLKVSIYLKLYSYVLKNVILSFFMKNIAHS